MVALADPGAGAGVGVVLRAPSPRKRSDKMAIEAAA